VVGDRECVRVDADDGESCRLTGMEGSELVGDTCGRNWIGGSVEEPGWEAVFDCCGCDRDLGLSLPVGPLPSGMRFAGGRFSAARRVLFSSSSSVTLVSNASRCAARRARKALWTSRARLGGRLSFRLRPRLEDIQ